MDYLGACNDLSTLGDAIVGSGYASHDRAHLGYKEELPLALKEAHRVLVPAANA